MTLLPAGSGWPGAQYARHVVKKWPISFLRPNKLPLILAVDCSSEMLEPLEYATPTRPMPNPSTNVWKQSMRTSLLIVSLSILMAAPSLADINETTSRYLRTEYMCRVATEEGLKPVPAGLDHFRMRNTNGVADLYGDGNIDFIFGFSDETFDIARLERANAGRETPWPIDMYVGNAERSWQSHQYSFYSPDAEFVVPDFTRFQLATFAVQDFNGDGIDDFVAAQFGRDYPPAVPAQNEVFLSGPDGYAFSVLPGGVGKNHGVTAGDIDTDGDVDIIIARGGRERGLRFLENDGTGQFALRSANGIQSRPDYGGIAQLWDIDGDGHLDLVVNRRSDPFDGGLAFVFWGEAGFGFLPDPTILATEDLVDTGEPYIRNGLPMPTAPGPLDFEFADFDGDGSTEIALVTQSDFYQRWQLSVAQFDNRSAETRVVDRSAEGALGSLFFIQACDLREDGTIDLVYEYFGQSFGSVWNRTPATDRSRLERYVWLNDGAGEFTRYMLESRVYFESRYFPYLAANAEWLGVASEGYVPPQQYFPNVLDDRNRYLHPFYDTGRLQDGHPYIMLPEIAERFPELTFSPTEPGTSLARPNDPTEISPRAAAIIRARGDESDQDNEIDGETAPSTTTLPTASPPRPSNSSTVSPRAQAVLDAIHRGADPSEALADAPSRAVGGATRPSVARSNDPAQISDRVRSIIEGRQSD